jgi:hypothetical protein
MKYGLSYVVRCRSQEQDCSSHAQKNDEVSAMVGDRMVRRKLLHQG